MNTYNDNLRNTVIALLQGQESILKALKNQYQAAKLNHFYAHGAAITAKAGLEAAEKDMQASSSVKSASQQAADAASNLAAAARAADQYVKASVSGMAVAAANVQVAANAILRLASDIGNIQAQVAAADYDSDIYRLTEELKRLITDTAYQVEVASQLAMEASFTVSEVSSATVDDQAMAASRSAAHLLTTASADFDTTSDLLASNKNSVVTATLAKNKAEAEVQRLEKEYYSALSAYSLTHKALNFDLSVKVSGKNTMEVAFDAVKEPFKKTAIADHYVLMLVKGGKKWAFTLVEAENMAIADNTRQVIKVIPEKTTRIRQVIDTAKLQDADGEPIKQGVDYVVFVIAILKDEYKTTINDFDDMLSAPSPAFSLTTPMVKVDAATLQVHMRADETYQISFTAEERLKHVAYRCILLPQPAFFFDPELAEQVSAANCLVAVTRAGGAQYHALIGPDATDCFGNPLIDGGRYKPVVLAIANVEGDEQPEYTSALSDAAKAEIFTYHAPKL